MPENSIFRKKSLDKISSPEQLNDYIMVTTPGVWMMLLSIIIVLFGAVVWGVFGRLDTRLSAPAVVEGGMATIYVEADEIKKIRLYQDVDIDGEEGYVSGIGFNSAKAEDILGDLALTEAGYEDNTIVYGIKAFVENVPDGIYMSEIVVDRVSPVTFLTGD